MKAEWTILKLVEWLTSYLNGKGVPEARLNAEHLISHSLKMTRMDLYLQFERLVSEKELKELKPLISRRAKREPLQYILGSQPFRNVELNVRPGVLIPRPETELLVEEGLRHIPEDGKTTILEIGVGSGAIVKAIASERINAKLTATEISKEALNLARKNVEEYIDRIELLEGNLFEPVKGKRFDLVVSNPPYIRKADWEKLEPEVRDYEPKVALCGGEDGLDFFRLIFNYAPDHLKSAGWLVLEFGDGQANAVRGLAERTEMFDKIDILKDLQGVERIAAARRSGGYDG